jgi:predicted nuclease of predicted toxin-antitoxin system
MKILVDMNLSPKWVDFLIENSIEAVHWSSIGSSDSPDIDIFAYAQKYDFTIFTNDLDFGFILAITHGKKPSVIQTRTGILGHDRIGDIVVSAIKMLAADIEKGALVTIDQQKTRVNLLPLIGN